MSARLIHTRKYKGENSKNDTQTIVMINSRCKTDEQQRYSRRARLLLLCISSACGTHPTHCDGHTHGRLCFWYSAFIRWRSQHCGATRNEERKTSADESNMYAFKWYERMSRKRRSIELKHHTLSEMLGFELNPWRNRLNGSKKTSECLVSKWMDEDGTEYFTKIFLLQWKIIRSNACNKTWKQFDEFCVWALRWRIALWIAASRENSRIAPIKNAGDMTSLLCMALSKV